MDQNQQSGDQDVVVDHSHDKEFFATFMLVLGALFGITFLIVVVAGMISDAGAEASGSDPIFNQRINDRIAPVGTVVTDASQLVVAKAAPAKARSVAEVVNGVCAGCHASGVLDAPKLGDKAAWKSVLAQGKADVYANAINGKGAMPARGGDASLSDDDVKAAVDYIFKDAGL